MTFCMRVTHRPSYKTLLTKSKMDSSEETEIEELEVETLGEEELEVLKLLKSFGLSDTVISAFIANRYNIDTLKVMERREVEELIQQPFLAERTKCIHGINTWRKGLNLPLLAEAGTAFPSTPLTPSLAPSASQQDMSRENCTAAFLMQSSTRGRAILTKYQSDQEPNKRLTQADKRAITQIVVDGFKDRFSSLTHLELKRRAIELHI